MRRYGTIFLVSEPKAHGVHDQVQRDQRLVFVEVKPVTRAEYYTANQTGFNASVVFALSNEKDYQDERFCIYCGHNYRVIRTYMTTNGGI